MRRVSFGNGVPLCTSGELGGSAGPEVCGNLSGLLFGLN